MSGCAQGRGGKPRSTADAAGGQDVGAQGPGPVLEPRGCTAFRSHSNSNMLIHPARAQVRSGKDRLLGEPALLYRPLLHCTLTRSSTALSPATLDRGSQCSLLCADVNCSCREPPQPPPSPSCSPHLNNSRHVRISWRVQRVVPPLPPCRPAAVQNGAPASGAERHTGTSRLMTSVPSRHRSGQIVCAEDDEQDERGGTTLSKPCVATAFRG